EFQRDLLRFLLDITQAYGDIVQMRFLNRPAFLIRHPDAVKHVLQENHQNYDKDNPFWHRLKLLGGESILTTDGTSWLQQRRIMQPAFHHQRISSFGPLITEATLTTRSQWHDSLERGEPLDIGVEMKRLTQRIIGQALFSIDLSNE